MCWHVRANQLVSRPIISKFWKAAGLITAAGNAFEVAMKDLETYVSFITPQDIVDMTEEAAAYLALCESFDAVNGTLLVRPHRDAPSN
jgi:hypothetical protein